VTILVIGRQGQVARALARTGDVAVLGRPELDLEDAAAARAAIVASKPKVVINAAAYTAVDKAEDDPDRAFAINAAGAEAVALGANDAGAPVIHVSTDYVFAGDKPSPYSEADDTVPAGVYGASKLEGEQRVFAVSARAIVVRTAWVFDAQGSNFVRTMLRLAKTRDQINVVADQRGCPTFAGDLASALLAIARNPAISGVFNCAGAGETTWSEFAGEIFAQSKARGGPSAEVAPISTSEYPTRARRPANSRLNCEKLASAYSVRMRPWQVALSACMDEIAASGWRVE
jgi:dTDP-4-dehydrorhamnose reductase